MTWRIFSLAGLAACLLILVRSGGWLCAVGTPLSLATACLISNEHTRLSGLSMWCPLWSNDNPRTTPSFPCICRTTFPFFHSLIFLVCDYQHNFSDIWYLVIRWVFESPLGCGHIHVSISSKHDFQPPSAACLVLMFLLHLLLPQWGGHFAPTSKFLELTLSSPLYRCHGRLRAGCSNSSRHR